MCLVISLSLSQDPSKCWLSCLRAVCCSVLDAMVADFLVFGLNPLQLWCREAAQLFVGQHDFTHFASQGNPDPNPIKTIYHFDVLQDSDGCVFQVDGSGFMYKMV